MDLTKGSEVVGSVKKIENYGLFLSLDSNQDAFLPKEEMFISKKKKLTDVLVEGYVIKAKVLSKKKDYYVVTQKHGLEQDNRQEQNNIDKKNSVKKKNKLLKDKGYSNNKITAENSPKNKKNSDSNIEQQNKQDNEGFREQKVTLDSLRTMTKIGNLKISQGKKGSKNIDVVSSKEEVKEFLEVPDNFMTDIITNFEMRHEQLEAVLERIKGRGLLNEN